MPSERYDRSDSGIENAVLAERERCAAILNSAARKQEQKHTEASGWYVDDGQQLWDLADEIRKGGTP